MGKKRKIYLHIGLEDGVSDVVGLALERHAHALLDLGVRDPARSREEMFRAAVEVLRTHKEWGYQRSKVEGTWAAMCRRAWVGRDTIVLSQPLLAAARPEQIALMLDSLAGFEVHVVVSAHAPDAWTSPGDPAQDLGSVLERWQGAVRAPERLHVIVAEDREALWRRFGRVVGFGTASLHLDALPAPSGMRATPVSVAGREEVLHRLGTVWAELLRDSEVDVVGDLADLVPAGPPARASETSPAEATSTQHALVEALHEIDRLSRSNDNLRERVATLEKKRAKLKRRLSDVA